MPAPHLPVLALDTSTEAIAAGLHTGFDGYTVQVPGGALASSQLIPQLRALLTRAGLSWADLGTIAFGRGPGAFTGLRTACAVAQGLGYGLQRPLLALDSLLIVAEDARVQAGAGDADFEVGVAMDARMNEVYAARYRWHAGHWQVLQPPGLFGLETLALSWTGLTRQALAGSALAAFGERLDLPATSSRFGLEADRAAALLRLALAAARRGVGLDAADALPLYLRDKVAHTSAEREATKRAAAAAAGTPPAQPAATAPRRA